MAVYPRAVCRGLTTACDMLWLINTAVLCLQNKTWYVHSSMSSDSESNTSLKTLNDFEVNQVQW